MKFGRWRADDVRFGRNLDDSGPTWPICVEAVQDLGAKRPTSTDVDFGRNRAGCGETKAGSARGPTSARSVCIPRSCAGAAAERLPRAWPTGEHAFPERESSFRCRIVFVCVGLVSEQCRISTAILSGKSQITVESVPAQYRIDIKHAILPSEGGTHLPTWGPRNWTRRDFGPAGMAEGGGPRYPTPGPPRPRNFVMRAWPSHTHTHKAKKQLAKQGLQPWIWTFSVSHDV